MASEGSRSGRHCLQPCSLDPGMSLLCKRHIMPTRQKLHSGVGRGPAQPPLGMDPPFGLPAHQPVEVWPSFSRLALYCQEPHQLLKTPVAGLLLCNATSAAARSHWHQFTLLSKGRSAYLSSKAACYLHCRPVPPLLWGGTGIVWPMIRTS
ncbi:hypothetical protein ABBQ32_14146 [Trebouxia sp. C0010 RCD-2024]